MRLPVIAGNWKMHKTTEEARALARAIKAGAGNATHCQVVLAPPYTVLAAVAAEIRGSALVLAAQNVHWQGNGAFTGEVSVPMLEDVGCHMVILGHSERRQLFCETDETVNKRLRAVVKSSLQPIVCVGETLAEREAERVQEVICQQLAGGLDGLTPPYLLRIILAYEPVVQRRPKLPRKSMPQSAIGSLKTLERRQEIRFAFCTVEVSSRRTSGT